MSLPIEQPNRYLSLLRAMQNRYTNMTTFLTSSIASSQMHENDSDPDHLYLQEYLQILKVYYFLQHISDLVQEIKGKQNELKLLPAVSPLILEQMSAEDIKITSKREIKQMKNELNKREGLNLMEIKEASAQLEMNRQIRQKCIAEDLRKQLNEVREQIQSKVFGCAFCTSDPVINVIDHPVTDIFGKKIALRIHYLNQQHKSIYSEDITTMEQYFGDQEIQTVLKTLIQRNQEIAFEVENKMKKTQLKKIVRKATQKNSSLTGKGNRNRKNKRRKAAEKIEVKQQVHPEIGQQKEKLNNQRLLSRIENDYLRQGRQEVDNCQEKRQGSKKQYRKREHEAIDQRGDLTIRRVDYQPNFRRCFDEESFAGELNFFSEFGDEEDEMTYEEFVRRCQQYVRDLILEFHEGNPACNRYKLKKNVKISNFFYKVKKYIYNLTELLKYEIIQDTAKRLSEKQEESDQKQIQVDLSSPHQDDEGNIIYYVQGSTGRYHIDLKECLIKGGRMGILTNSKDNFRVANFSIPATSTYLCFMSYEGKDRRIAIRGISRKDLPKKMYFIDLDSIISHVREFAAIKVSKYSPRIDDLLRYRSNKPVTHPNRKSLLMSHVLDTIKIKRNGSQVRIIEELSQMEEGIFLIQGPPGTGKTETIVNFVSLEHQYSKLSLKREEDPSVIMVCAQSNEAINHIVRKIVKEGLLGSEYKIFTEGFPPRVLRLGSTEEYDEELLSVNLAHLCEEELKKQCKCTIELSSARLRYEKLLKYEEINKLTTTLKIKKQTGTVLEQKQVRHQLEQLKDQLYEIKEQLVQLSDLIYKNWLSYVDIEKQFLNNCDIVACTLNTSGKTRYSTFFRGKIFCLIIDEASQATEPSVLVPFQSMTKKMILVGDHMQLPPTVISERESRYTKFGRSLFERLIDNGATPHLLSTQYRMLSELSDFPNRAFYQGQLKDGKEHHVPLSLRMSAPSWFIDVPYGAEEVIKRSYQNMGEAKVVMFLISRLLRAGEGLSIGVISPYKSQIRCLESEIEKRDYPKEVQRRLKVSTVDAFQGQERDVIIVTSVRANTDGKIGFVSCEKRLNVSITRAKYALFVFGNASTLLAYDRQPNFWAHFITEHQQNGTMVSGRDQGEVQGRIQQMLITSL